MIANAVKPIEMGPEYQVPLTIIRINRDDSPLQKNGFINVLGQVDTISAKLVNSTIVVIHFKGKNKVYDMFVTSISVPN